MFEEIKSFLSFHKTSETGLQVHLHPLVLLTVSDHVTRHISRRRDGPIVGALLGRQYGREISLEFAFECDTVEGINDPFLLNESWFKDRLQQYKDVHKAPPLELVGWFTTAPETGPEYPHVPIHQQILRDYNETAVLLAFHPSAVSEGSAVGGKLPLTIYESVYETVTPEGHYPGQYYVKMEIEDEDSSPGLHLELRFRELPYFVETGEAEMIGVDSVARGGGNATATGDPKTNRFQVSQDQPSFGRSEWQEGKQKEDEIMDETGALSPEDEELISSLTARANAIKMLHTRIGMLKTYLTSLPPSYLNTPTSSEPSSDPPNPQHSEINHPILRSIQALVNRLPLVVPADHKAFEQDRLAERSDVALVDLLSHLTKSVRDVREVGRKFEVIEQARAAKKGPSLASDDFLMSGEKVEPTSQW